MLSVRLLALAAMLAVHIGDIVTSSDCVADIVLVLDNSKSIAGEKATYDPNVYKNWVRQINFTKDLVSKLNVGPATSHVALVDFGDAGYFDFDLKTHTSAAAVQQGLDALPYRGEYTNTYRGLNWARRILTDSEFGKRSSRIPKVIVLITDGEPTVEGNKIPDEVKFIKNAGIRIVVVGIIAADKSDAALKAIATSPSDYFRTFDFKSLDGVKDRVVNEDTCRPLPVTYPDTPVAECLADIVYVIDNSASISGSLAAYTANPAVYPNWKRQITFAQAQLLRFNVDYPDSHVALVDFGDNAKIDFNFVRTLQQAHDGIGALQYAAGLTNTYRGLRLARQIVTESEYGRRGDDVPKVIVLVTDGLPNVESEFLLDEVDLIKKQGIRIVVVYVAAPTLTRNIPLMKLVASKDEDFIHVNDFKALANVQLNIVDTTDC